ncbi:MAG: arylformamidase [Clostridia bacterium]|jgi:arylformamidase|nr:arylformamidase [Clostridia bacterium]
MKIIDISQTLEEPMVYYPSVKKFEFKWARHYSKGDISSLSEISMGSHVGTHLDSPYHFIENGKNLNEMDLDIFYGKARVIEVPEEQDKITAEFLKTIGDLDERILFKTKNSRMYELKVFKEDYVYIDREAAAYIAQFPVKLVGIDYVSVDMYKKSKEAHMILLSRGIALLENIVLNEVNDGLYKLVCFPIKVKDAEAALCRAVLIEE